MLRYEPARALNHCLPLPHTLLNAQGAIKSSSITVLS